MDPVTGAIVAALAAGVASGATKVGEKVIVGAYDALKAALKKKYGEDSKVAHAVAAVEEEPDFKPNQEALAGRIEQAKAADDPQLQQLAQALLDALKDTSAGKKALSKYHIEAHDSEIGVIGDGAHVEGGIHFGKSRR